MDNLEPVLLDELLSYVGSLASVYHKPPSAFGLVSKKTTVRRAPPCMDTRTRTRARG